MRLTEGGHHEVPEALFRSAPSQSRWYVVHTQPHAEGRAECRLQAQGFVTCAPKIWRTVRHARQTKLSAAPLFPRYIFVELDLGRHQWRSINGTSGVSCLVSSQDRPLPLPAGLVEEIMASQLSGVSPAREPELKLNDPVRLNTGPFADLVGRIQRIDAKGRVQILLELMGRTVSVKTAATDCRRVSI